MNPPANPTDPKKQAPTLAALRQQAAGTRKPSIPVAPKKTELPLTPEELKQRQANEQALVVKGNKWKDDAKLTDEEQDLGLYTIKTKESQAVDRDSKDVAVRDVVQLCQKKQKRKLFVVNCVPGDVASKRPLNKEVLTHTKADQIAKRGKDKTGKDYDLKIDYDEISKSEGGSFSKGYVPWGVQIKVLEENVGTKEKPSMRQIMTVVTDRKTDKQEKKSVLTGAPNNRSGVTVGSGVDLGQKDEADYRKAFQKAAKNGRFHTAEEATALSDKLKPYMKLTRTDACQYLRKHPLTLTDADLDFMNYQSFMAHTDEVIERYEKQTGKNFADLSKEEQTSIFSYAYHHGSMKRDVHIAFGNYDKDKVLAAFAKEREHGYLKKFYDGDVGSVRDKAHEAAKQAAALAKKTAAALKAAKAQAKVVADSTKVLVRH